MAQRDSQALGPRESAMGVFFGLAALWLTLALVFAAHRMSDAPNAATQKAAAELMPKAPNR